MQSISPPPRLRPAGGLLRLSGVSLTALAEAAGLSKGHTCLVLQGKRRPNARLLAAWEALGVEARAVANLRALRVGLTAGLGAPRGPA